MAAAFAGIQNPGMGPLDEVSRDLRAEALEDQWRNALCGAATESDLLAVARRYLAGWDRKALTLLPESCQPRAVSSAREVSLLTFRLKRAYCSAFLDPMHEPGVERMLAFFEALTERLFALRSSKSAPV